LTAVADSVPERCAHAAPGVPAYESAAALVAAGAVDAIVVATPASAHLSDAGVAAEAGLPSLVEKPPAPTAADAAELARLRPAPHLAFNRRFVTELNPLRELARAQARLAIDVELRMRSSAWAAYVADDDALLDLGPHLVDLVRWLSGAEVVRTRGRVSQSRAQVELELDRDRGYARLSCASDRPYRERVGVRSADGDVRGAYTRGGVVAAARSVLHGHSGDHPLVPLLVRQLEAFARVVLGEVETTLAHADDGVAVMATLEAARESARRGGVWEPVRGAARA
jgi:predicted dehydrogenase